MALQEVKDFFVVLYSCILCVASKLLFFKGFWQKRKICLSQEECPDAANGAEDVDLPPLKTRLILAMEEA